MSKRSPEDAMKWLSYDKESGVFTWKNAVHQAVEIGAVAGSLRHGYIAITVNNHAWLAHRLAWEISHGEIPAGKEIDHINGVRSDNRISNLRLATRSENNQNRRSARRDNKSGFAGVTQHKRSGLFNARITAPGGKKLSLGYFKTPEEAGDAYLKCKREIHTFNTI